MTETAVADRYEGLAAEAAGLGDAIEQWCSDGDDRGARDAVVATRSAWLELAPFWFGPAEDRRSRFIIDPAPRAADIEDLVASQRPVDAASLAELAGADQRGLGAIEILLDGNPEVRRCDYAAAAAELVVDEADALAHEWSTYGATLGDDDAAANMALRDIVSETLFSVRMADDVAGYQAASRLAGIEWVLLGDGVHVGISELVSDDTVDRLAHELDSADVAALEITISTEVVGDLGTAVNFSDADGDG